MITLTQIAVFRDTDTLEKARHGRYADTAKNRRLHRVGQEYGSKKQEELESEKKPQAQQETEQPKKERNGDSVKRELELLEEHKDSIVEKYGEKAYNKKVESLKKEGEDFEQKETVKELKERADKEDADKAKNEQESSKKEVTKEDIFDALNSYNIDNVKGVFDGFDISSLSGNDLTAIHDKMDRIIRDASRANIDSPNFKYGEALDPYIKEVRNKMSKSGDKEDKALQEAIGKYKEKQEYLKKEVQAIKDMAKKLKRKVDSDELEDIMYDFEVWMDDYGSELKYDIEKEAKEDGLSVEDVQFALEELEEYALSYYEQDVEGVKEELEGLMDEYFPKKGEKFTFEEMPDADKMSKAEFKAYLKTPEGKKRYRLAENFQTKAIKERDKRKQEIRDRFRDYYPEIEFKKENIFDRYGDYTLIFPSNSNESFAGVVSVIGSNDTPLNKENIIIMEYTKLSKEGKELLEKVSNDENFFRKIVEIGMDIHNFEKNSREKLNKDLRTKFPDVTESDGYIRYK